MSYPVSNGDLVVVKTVDGNFMVGKYTEYGEDMGRFVTDAFMLMLRQITNGEVQVAIADFMAPFVQDGQGVVLTERDWIGVPKPMPKSLEADYTQKKTGIRITSAMPNKSGLVVT